MAGARGSVRAPAWDAAGARDGCERPRRPHGTPRHVLWQRRHRRVHRPRERRRLRLTRRGTRRPPPGVHEGYDATQQVPDAHRGGVSRGGQRIRFRHHGVHAGADVLVQQLGGDLQEAVRPGLRGRRALAGAPARAQRHRSDSVLEAGPVHGRSGWGERRGDVHQPAAGDDGEDEAAGGDRAPGGCAGDPIDSRYATDSCKTLRDVPRNCLKIHVVCVVVLLTGQTRGSC